MNWTELIGQTLIHFIWQGGLLMGLAMVFLLLLRRSSAQSRYLVCCGVLFLMAVTPVITALLIAPAAAPPAVVNGGVAELPRVISLEPHRSVSTLPMPDESTLQWIVMGWLVGVAALTIRVFGGFVTLAALARKGRHAVPADLQERFEALAARMGLRRLPKLYLSDRVSVPTVIGAFRGVVLLPVSVVTGMPVRMLETILVHELAHVARFDFLVNAFQAVIEVVLFYHPAVWWVSQRIREERENCCDDLVIATLSDRKTYARALTTLAELRGHSLAVRADGGELLVRVRRILGETSMKSILSPFPIAILLGALILVPAIQSYAAYPEPPIIGLPGSQSSADKKPDAPAVKHKRSPKAVDPFAKQAAPTSGRTPKAKGPSADKSPFSAKNVVAPPAEKTRAANQDPFGKVPSADVPNPPGQIPYTIPSVEKARDNDIAPFVNDAPKVGSKYQSFSRLPRQAAEYHIEQLNLDLEALLEQRKFLTELSNQTERELVEREMELQAIQSGAAVDGGGSKEARVKEIHRMMGQIISQLKVLEQKLEDNTARLARKREELRKVWEGG